MATDTTVPGVYIEEDASPAMSVSAGATAVPLFVARFTPLKSELAGAITRIGSWLDYTSLFDSNVPSSARVTVKSSEVEPPPASEETKKASSTAAARDGEATKQYTYQINDIAVLDPTASVALRLYFQNGGGPCYLYPLEKADDKAKLAALPGLVDEVGAITLLACPDPDEAYRTAVYAALAASLGLHKGYFLLADSVNGDAPSAASGSAQVAVYYPNVEVPHTRTLDDMQVVVADYKDGSDTTIATLADLRTANADFAGVIDQALAGNKAEEAYFVRVGKGITMTQDEINQGKMVVQVGMAAVRPAEFIILKFTQDMSQ